jgi:hypothetical protein
MPGSGGSPRSSGRVWRWIPSRTRPISKSPDELQPGPVGGHVADLYVDQPGAEPEFPDHGFAEVRHRPGALFRPSDPKHPIGGQRSDERRKVGGQLLPGAGEHHRELDGRPSPAAGPRGPADQRADIGRNPEETEPLAGLRPELLGQGLRRIFRHRSIRSRAVEAAGLRSRLPDSNRRPEDIYGGRRLAAVQTTVPRSTTELSRDAGTTEGRTISLRAREFTSGLRGRCAVVARPVPGSRWHRSASAARGGGSVPGAARSGPGTRGAGSGRPPVRRPPAG